MNPKRKIFDFPEIQLARRMGRKVSFYPSANAPIYVEILDDRYPSHLTHVGYEPKSIKGDFLSTRKGYFIDAMLGSHGTFTESTIRKDGLTKNELRRWLNRCLSGADISVAIKRRLRKK